ncbi:hypothetical protein J437_LFUL002413 [Ladona fulva]|uniref:Adenosine 3'-phospho 5'-phosphosulfate transporter 2 n=1 Tax=Ladona fulva TaxID=123851 RepID=A0A8K0KN00_LADFU|nr:hypothetical protein J437_LFUL002413 [Ladona fulva]
METRIQMKGSEKGEENILKQEKSETKLLWFSISEYSSYAQFLLCCSAVFVFYLMYGYLQELIFTLEGFKPYGWYLTLVQFAYYSAFGWTERKLQHSSERKIPLKTYLLLALLTLGTMGFSNSSLGYLNYPTQVIFKCCKLIPVLIGGILIQGKRYGIIDFVAALCMCLGLSLFTLADSMVSPNFNILGVMMISSALVCDAAIGNVQEKYMKIYKAPNTEVVLYSYAIGFMYLFIHPWETYGYGLLFSITGYLGLQVVLTLVRTCGALAAVTVTTCRKAVTIIISFAFFQKPFTFQYLWSGLLVILGIYLNVYSKNQDKLNLRSYVKTLQNVLKPVLITVLKPFRHLSNLRVKESKRLLSHV